MVLTPQNVANSPITSYPVAKFTAVVDGKTVEIQGVALVDSTGAEYNTGNPLPTTGGGGAGGSVYITDASSNQVQVSPVDPTKFGFRTISTQAWVLFDQSTAEAGSTTTVINCTAHTALVGQLLVRTYNGDCSIIESTTPNTITLANALSSDPSNATISFMAPSLLETKNSAYGAGLKVAPLQNETFPVSLATLPAVTVTSIPTANVFDAAGSYNLVDTFTGAASGAVFDQSGFYGLKYFSLQVTQTGGVTVWSVFFEVSNDGVNYTPLLTITNADGDGAMKFAGPIMANMFRTRCSGITGGTNVKAYWTATY